MQDDRSDTISSSASHRAQFGRSIERCGGRHGEVDMSAKPCARLDVFKTKTPWRIHILVLKKKVVCEDILQNLIILRSKLQMVFSTHFCLRRDGHLGWDWFTSGWTSWWQLPVQSLSQVNYVSHRLSAQVLAPRNCCDESLDTPNGSRNLILDLDTFALRKALGMATAWNLRLMEVERVCDIDAILSIAARV